MENQTKTDHDLIESLLSALAAPDRDPRPAPAQAGYDMIKLMDQMPGGFFIYRADEDEEIIYANKALLRIFNCETMAEFRSHTGNSFRGIVHPEDLEAVEESIWEQISQDQHHLDYVEYRIIQKGGHKYIFDIKCQ